MIHRHFTRTAPSWASGVALAAALSVAGGTGASAGDLAIEIAGVHSEEGAIMIAVHGLETAGQFPDATGARYQFRLPALAGAVRLAVPGVAPGRYAIAAFHDENGNGELDANLLGIPTEGLGISNDASSIFGPPDFEAAALDLGAEPAAVRVTLSY